MQLDCPFCGLREVEEFHCRGSVPEPVTDPVRRVYQRVNRTDLSVEYWQHTGGCRAWLECRRNPSTGEVLAVSWVAATPGGGP